MNNTENSAIRNRFLKLREEWLKDTLHSSDPNEISSHPSYQKIIEMGEEALPLILKDLEENKCHWYVALKEIIGYSPIRKESIGDIKKVRRDWLEWGKRKGLI